MLINFLSVFIETIGSVRLVLMKASTEHYFSILSYAEGKYWGTEKRLSFLTVDFKIYTQTIARVLCLRNTDNNNYFWNVSIHTFAGISCEGCVIKG